MDNLHIFFESMKSLFPDRIATGLVVDSLEHFKEWLTMQDVHVYPAETGAAPSLAAPSLAAPSLAAPSLFGLSVTEDPTLPPETIRFTYEEPKP